MNARARNVLDRFPAHMEAAREGKRLADVTEALAFDIETLSGDLAAIRRSRRVAEAGELIDLMRIGALHGVAGAELAILYARRDAVDSLLRSPGPETPQTLIGLWGLTDTGEPLDRYPAPEDLFAFARLAMLQKEILNHIRRRLIEIGSIHAKGNGTVRALIYGVANALDLDVTSIAHSRDRYLHTAHVRDRLRLGYQEEENGTVVNREFEPSAERLLIEENPLTAASGGKSPRKHGELFSILRRGFERAVLRVQVEGIQNRTFGPMLVNRDEGHGVGYAGSVPAGETLEFLEEGRAVLGSQDVTANAFAWQGACYAAGTEAHLKDFVFAGPGLTSDRAASFARSTPLNALQSNFVFPHAGDGLPMPGLDVGETRFAFFAQEAHFSQDGNPVLRVPPRPAVGFADQSVFAPGPAEERQPAAQVTLEWQERKAFWVNVWIPKRFRKWKLDDEEGRATRDSVELALNRFRPAGVRVNVEFQDDRWTLGRGILPEADKISIFVAPPGSGSELWQPPE